MSRNRNYKLPQMIEDFFLTRSFTVESFAKAVKISVPTLHSNLKGRTRFLLPTAMKIFAYLEYCHYTEDFCVQFLKTLNNIYDANTLKSDRIEE
jgi:hypothetical protein